MLVVEVLADVVASAVCQQRWLLEVVWTARHVDGTSWWSSTLERTVMIPSANAKCPWFLTRR